MHDPMTLSAEISRMSADDKNALLAYLCGYTPEGVTACLRILAAEKARRSQS